MDSATTNRAIRSATETQQERIWKGDFGREYTERNTVDTASLDQLWRRNYGVARSTINESFLSRIPKDAKFLEVGCNAGNQLLMLSQMGWSNLSGTELQPFAMEIARSRLPSATFKLGSALALPWDDGSFDVVFTCGVLIHISPTDLPTVMDEIYRTTKEYIWGTEYYAPEVTQVTYRDHSELLWKMDFARQYMRRFPDLELVREQRLPYLDNANVDAVFLLRKKRRP
ncbi:MAG TPA: pseudaminic acid biosynthesis-associated methylase [Candidatus Sulfotelmatobacter sp.]|nr:pseudaminic acid biosynthesis-associated methylase [Candidatus Sulfotelmatobacter sp.]